MDDDFGVKLMSQALLHILGMMLWYNRKVKILKTATKAINGTSLLHNILNVFPSSLCLFLSSSLQSLVDIRPQPKDDDLSRKC